MTPPCLISAVLSRTIFLFFISRGRIFLFLAKCLCQSQPKILKFQRKGGLVLHKRRHDKPFARNAFVASRQRDHRPTLITTTTVRALTVATARMSATSSARWA